MTRSRVLAEAQAERDALLRADIGISLRHVEAALHAKITKPIRQALERASKALGEAGDLAEPIPIPPPPFRMPNVLRDWHAR